MSIVAVLFLSEMMVLRDGGASNSHTRLTDTMGMNRPGLLIYDDGEGDFGPLTDPRPAYDLRTGARTTRQRIERIVGQAADALVATPRLRPLTAPLGIDLAAAEQWRIVNGRCANADAIRSAPVVSVADARRMLETSDWPAADPAAYTRPWHIIAGLDANLRHDLDTFDLPAWRDDRGQHVARQGDYPVHVAADAKIHPMVVLNSELGPIVIDRGAIVGSFAVLAGPCYIGEGSIVPPHSHIRAHTVAGPRCVVGGEVSFTVMQGYSNKSHAGYLGHSLVGQWVNLGAETTVSNLKNTYGTIRVALRPASAGEDSGQSKLGPIIGDYVRTAIGTRLLTGSCVGTGSMLALSGFSPKCINRFRFITDEGNEPYDIDRFLATARRMMSRREQPLDPPLEAVLRELAAGTV